MNLKLLINTLKEIQQECNDKMTDLDEVDEKLRNIIEELEAFVSKRRINHD